MSLTVSLLCPHCAAVVDMHSHRHGVCTRCRTDLTVTVTETWSRTRINRDAPFFPLVELIDNLEHTDPRGRWRHPHGHPQQIGKWRRISTAIPSADGGGPQAAARTIT